MAINNAAALRDWFLRYATDEGPTGILQNFLAVSHSGDGTLLTSAVQTAIGGSLAAINVTMSPYSCVGDDATDNTAGIILARAAAVAAGLPLYFPKGVYKVNGDLGVARNYERIIGDGADISYIKQYTNNVPVLKWGGYESSIEGIGLTYNTAQGVANTAAYGLELYAPSWCTIDRLMVSKANVGIGIKQAGTTVGGGGGTLNYIASCSVRDVIVQGFSNKGVELFAFGGGSSGCVFENIYILPRDAVGTRIDVAVGLDVLSMGDGVFSQINIEGGNPNIAVQFASSDGISLNSIHLEQLIPKSTTNGFLFLNGGSYNISGLLVAYCQILTANVASYNIIRVANDTRVNLTNLTERNSTVTAATFTEWLFSGYTNVQVFARNVKTAGTTGIGFMSSPGVFVERNGRAPQELSGNRGDVDVTLTAGADAVVQQFATALTANRTITLTATTTASCKFRVVRTGLGAFTLNVGGLKTIPAGTAAWVDVETDGGGTWTLTGYGTL